MAKKSLKRRLKKKKFTSRMSKTQTWQETLGVVVVECYRVETAFFLCLFLFLEVSQCRRFSNSAFVKAGSIESINDFNFESVCSTVRASGWTFLTCVIMLNFQWIVISFEFFFEHK
jgi:hypothetical protein